MLTLGSGAHTITLSGPTVFNGNLSLATTVQFSDFDATGTLNISSGTNVSFLGNASFAGQMNAQGANLTFSGPTAYVDTQFADSANVTINTNATFTHFTMAGEELFGNGILNVADGAFGAQSGYIDFTGTFSGFSSITKTTAQTLSIGALPASFTGPINIEQGTINLAAGAGTVTLNIESASGAGIQFGPGTYYNAINLNNSNGGIFETTEQNGATILAGPVDLGTIGSTITPGQYVQNESFQLAGPVTGGALSFAGAGLGITGLATYTGPTLISNFGILQLYGNGTLAGTSSITVEGNGELYITNDGTSLPDRIPDSTPIYLNTGAIELDGILNSGTGSFETLGPVVATGADTITVLQQNSGPTSSVALTITSLSVSPGSAVQFDGGGYGTFGGPAATDPKIYISSQASTNFMGGAYTFGGIGLDFVHYGADGVKPFSASDYYTGSPSGWNSTTVAMISGPGAIFINGTFTVQALKINTSGGPTSLNLEATVLNITSGGFILDGASVGGDTISRLTAGGTAPGQLFLYGNGTISTDISDNPGPDGLYASTPGGPQDMDNGSVTVVVEGFGTGTGGITEFTGGNTYTGETYVIGNQLYVSSAKAVSGSGLALEDGGYYVAQDFTAQPKNLIVENGQIGGIGALDASSYTISGATVTLPIVGGGPMNIVDGNCLIDSSNGGSLQGYTGTISINNGGTLTLGTQENATSGTLSLGSGQVLINSGGLLQIGDQSGTNFPATGNVELNGGMLSAVMKFVGNLHAIADSTISGGPFVQTVEIDPGVELALQGTVTFNDGASGGGTLYVAPSQSAFLDSEGPFAPVSVRVDGTLTSGPVSLGSISGTGEFISPFNTLITSDGITVSTLVVQGYDAIRSGDGNLGTSKIGSLIIGSGTAGQFTGQLDITNNAFILEATDPTDKAAKIAFLQSAVLSGSNGGTWTGEGITSSAVAADAAAGTNNSYHTTLGIFDNGAFPSGTAFTSFGGQPVDANSILITRALVGDANLDGTVNNTDLVALLTHYNQTGQTQATGDYNGDGTVNNTDLVALLTDYGQSLPGGMSLAPADALDPSAENFATSPVPEPTSLSLFPLAVAALILRRRRDLPPALRHGG